jgi:hypothetical protein
VSELAVLSGSSSDRNSVLWGVTVTVKGCRNFDAVHDARRRIERSQLIPDRSFISLSWDLSVA